MCKSAIAMFFLLANAVGHATQTDFYTWTVESVDHPLWVALADIPVEKAPDQMVAKMMPGLSCLRTEEKPYSTTCDIYKYITPKQVYEIYEQLKVAEVDTNALQVKAKVLGPLIVRGDLAKVEEEDDWRYNLSKVYFNHPCQYVHDELQGKRCLGFWARKIFISYEDRNELGMSNKLDAKDGVPMVTELSFGKEEAHRVQDLISGLDYFAAMLEYQSELHIYYLGLKMDANAVPVIIQKVNSVDIPWAVRMRLNERAEKEKVPVHELIEEFNTQIDDFTAKVVLRNKGEPFQDFRAELKESIQRELSKAP